MPRLRLLGLLLPVFWSLCASDNTTAQIVTPNANVTSGTVNIQLSVQANANASSYSTSETVLPLGDLSNLGLAGCVGTLYLASKYSTLNGSYSFPNTGVPLVDCGDGTLSSAVLKQITRNSLSCAIFFSSSGGCSLVSPTNSVANTFSVLAGSNLAIMVSSAKSVQLMRFTSAGNVVSFSTAVLAIVLPVVGAILLGLVLFWMLTRGPLASRRRRRAGLVSHHRHRRHRKETKRLTAEQLAAFPTTIYGDTDEEHGDKPTENGQDSLTAPTSVSADESDQPAGFSRLAALVKPIFAGNAHTTPSTAGSSSAIPLDNLNTSAHTEDTEPDVEAGLEAIQQAVRDSVDEWETCTVCLEGYTDGELLRTLPCGHRYHAECIDKWLLTRSVCCPLCRYDCMEMHAAVPEAPAEPPEPAAARPGA